MAHRSHQGQAGALRSWTGAWQRGSHMAQRLTPYKSGINYWLLAVDPDVYSFQDLQRDTRAVWRHVKDYSSLKHLRDVESDEQALIFHAGTENAIVGVARFISDPYPDPQG